MTTTKNDGPASPPEGWQEPVTDEQIREYVRDHWREQWMGGSAGKGIVNDASIILFSETTPYDSKDRIRSEFARLIAHARREGSE